ncbi:winged helix-turn-helix domain-containing protein [Maricaulis sp.]|uniref:winged helix-turn-helix domain-containing protein n=1 Tax=Maricaulis sp. TaxID=1486257 RepID=UPI0032982216
MVGADTHGTGIPVLRLDPVAMTAEWGGKAVSLPDLSFKLLALLSERSPEPVAFSEIEAAVWGHSVTRETLKQRARLVRSALKETGAPDDLIRPVHARGYRLAVASQPATAMPAPANSRLVLRIAAGLAGMLLICAGLATGIWNKASSASERDARVIVLDTGSFARSTPEQRIRRNEINRDLTSRLSRLQRVHGLIALSEAQGSVADQARQAGADYLVDMRVTGGEGGDAGSVDLRLVSVRDARILHTARYGLADASMGRVLDHFALDVQAALESDRRLRRADLQNDPAARAYFSALELSEAPTRTNLEQAIALLSAVEPDESQAFILSLRARLRADLVLRHGANAQLAATALQDAETAIAAAPELAEFRYSLARAQLASGQREAALETLRSIEPHMPGVARDIAALDAGQEG